MSMKTTLRRLAEIVEIELVDQALDRHADLCCLVSCVEAVRHCDDSNAEKLQPLDDGVGIANVTREPGELVYGYGIERGGPCARGFESLLETLQSVEAGAGDRRIGIIPNDLVAVAFRPALDNPPLVKNRRVALIIGTVAAIKGDLQSRLGCSVWKNTRTRRSPAVSSRRLKRDGF